MALPVEPGTMTVNEYLRSSFDPDCDYVDGFIEERNLGEYDHARLQTLIAAWFFAREREWRIRTVVEQRVQVSESRFRIPDVSLLRRELPIEQIIRTAPLVCIEVLSPEDTVRRVRVRVADYHKMGVEQVWVLDPDSKEAFVCAPDGWYKPERDRLTVPGSEIYIPLDKIFADLDEQ